MLHQPISNDHTLSESFYQALIHHFIDHLTPSIQALLENCYFGIAPNSANIKTFFVVAADVSTADQLIQEKSQILHRMNTLMVGIGQLAICISPSDNPTETALCHSSVQPQSDRSLPQYMMCQIFDLSQAS
ncbi:MAG: hypothetical protein WBA77_02985 [Microcoleaceae cyanobacterium]